MSTDKNRPIGLSVAEGRGAFTVEHTDIHAGELNERHAEAKPHEDVVEFLLEKYRDVMVELAQR